MISVSTGVALTFVETLTQCTSNTDGILSSTLLLAASCIPFGTISYDNGCKTGTFNAFNDSTTCKGNFLQSIPKDTCTEVGSSASKIIVRCSTYNDNEYLRQAVYFTHDGHGDPTCQSALKTVQFIRLGFCYPANAGSSVQYDKVNATTLQTSTFSDGNCRTPSVTAPQKETVDGTCLGSAQSDFVSASSLLGNSATVLGMSTSLMVVASILMAAFML